MTTKRRILTELVALSRALGEPCRAYVALGEGNTSAAIDRHAFWVKASGVPLQEIRPGGFIEVRHRDMDAAVRRPHRASPPGPRPSIEALFHSWLLQIPGVRFVGHTHPTSVNRILCSQRSRVLFRRRLFPDEIVYCGSEPVYVPYGDPGLPLARAIQRRVLAFRRRHGEPPRLILLENHGIIALGRTPQEVLRITTMAVKTAEILWGAALVGPPRFLTRVHAAQIARRPDEAYRRRLGT